MKILSIDASSKSTGIAIFQNGKLIYHQNIIVKSSLDVLTRIKKMTNRIQEIYNKYKPTDIVMQQILPQDVRHNQKVFKALIYLQASIVLMLHTYKKQVTLYVASHWRSLCGIKTGRGVTRDRLKQASKDLVRQNYGLVVNDDISDAICIGIAYYRENGSAF